MPDSFLLKFCFLIESLLDMHGKRRARVIRGDLREFDVSRLETTPSPSPLLCTQRVASENALHRSRDNQMEAERASEHAIHRNQILLPFIHHLLACARAQPLFSLLLGNLRDRHRHLVDLTRVVLFDIYLSALAQAWKGI